MKKLLTILLTLFLFSSAYAEVRVVDKLEYRDGIAYAVGEGEGFSGKLVTTYSNGKKETEINYQDGKQEGLDIWWWRNGNKGRESQYKNNQLDGLETEWRENGYKEAEAHYINGKQDGLETEWFRTGEKYRESNWSKGDKNGLEASWFRTGEKRSEENYKNGNEHGLSTTWYDYGPKKSEANYKNGNELDKIKFEDIKAKVKAIAEAKAAQKAKLKQTVKLIPYIVIALFFLWGSWLVTRYLWTNISLVGMDFIKYVLIVLTMVFALFLMSSPAIWKSNPDNAYMLWLIGIPLVIGVWILYGLLRLFKKRFKKR
jgi:antitoxin component YwqK of YwqJK toxin-antitoxin module